VSISPDKLRPPLQQQWGLWNRAVRQPSWAAAIQPQAAGPLGLLDNCIFTPVSAGLADFQVAAPVLSSMTPSQAGAVVGTRYPYAARSADQTQWEIGLGTYGLEVLYRTSVIWSSNGNQLVNFSVIPTVSIDALTDNFRWRRTQRSVTTTPVVILPTDQVLNCNIPVPGFCQMPSSASRNGVPLTIRDVGGQFAANNLTLAASGNEKFVDNNSAAFVFINNYQEQTFDPLTDGVNLGWKLQ
jgi:hypothetical protein